MSTRSAGWGGAGVSVAEALALLAILGLMLAATIPAVAGLRAARGRAAAREMALTLQAMRWKSVASGVGHGLFFERDGEGWYWREVQDGNGNGLRTAELRNGTDRVLNGPFRIGHRVEGVRFGFPEGAPPPGIPPRPGVIGNLSDPVQFGNSNLIGFSPLGRSSSGTLYLTDDREELYGVVLFGPTARVRVWRMELRTRRWRL